MERYDSSSQPHLVGGSKVLMMMIEVGNSFGPSDKANGGYRKLTSWCGLNLTVIYILIKTMVEVINLIDSGLELSTSR